MKKLKEILLEVGNIGNANLHQPFTLSDSDPYEYYFNNKDKQWYTKLKKDSNWVLLKNIANDYNLAVDRLKKGPRYSMQINKSSVNIKTNNTNDLQITRDKLGYIPISEKSKIINNGIKLKTSELTFWKDVNNDNISRKTGYIDSWGTNVSYKLNGPGHAPGLIIKGIKELKNKKESGAYSGEEDPNNNKSFTYLYIFNPATNSGAWIQSNLVDIIDLKK